MGRLVAAAALTLALVFGAFSVRAEDGFTVGGRLSATDQEAQEGYFAIDQETMVVVKPRSPFHNYLKSKVGQRVRITVEPLRDSE